MGWVRLVHKKGILTGKGLTRIQEWALVYLVNHDNLEEHKVKLEEKKEDFKSLLFAHDPKRYYAIFGDPEDRKAAMDSMRGFDGVVAEDDGSGEMVFSADNLDEIDDLESFLMSLGTEQEMTLAEEDEGEWT